MVEKFVAEELSVPYNTQFSSVYSYGANSQQKPSQATLKGQTDSDSQFNTVNCNLIRI